MGARSRFYANMSHELRTPINAILGYTSLLLDHIYGPLKEQQVTSIERTHKAANHLLELVNDILDLSKIEAGKMELQVESVRFPDLLQDLFITVAPVAEQHQVELSMEGRSEPFAIVSDARRVRQILLNLLSNAIKFGGGKPVRAVWSAREDGGLVVEVIDQGSGIAPEDQEKIFDEFVQLEHQQNALGTGLGLPISRRLAELLGGELTVTSAPGAGSTFRLSLPPADLAEEEQGSSERMAVGR
jgi:signal transduction histidine kinase